MRRARGVVVGCGRSGRGSGSGQDRSRCGPGRGGSLQGVYVSSAGGGGPGRPWAGAPLMWFSRTAGSSSSSSTDRSIWTPHSHQPVPCADPPSTYIPKSTPTFRTHLPQPRRHPPHHHTHNPHHLPHQLGVVRNRPIPASHKVAHDQRQQRPYLQVDLGASRQRRQQIFQRRRRRRIRAQHTPDQRQRWLVKCRCGGGRERGRRRCCCCARRRRWRRRRGAGREVPGHRRAG